MASPEAVRPIPIRHFLSPLAVAGGPNLFAEEDQRPIKGRSFENLKAFLQRGAVAPAEVFGEGQKPDYTDESLYYPPIGPRQTPSEWKRNIEITYDYVFGEETLDEIGARQKKKITRDRVRQIVKEEVGLLLKNAHNNVQREFSLDNFDFQKPLTLTSRKRRSEARGGISLEIARRIESGEPFDSISKNYTPAQIAKARKVLEGWGVNVPRKRESVLPT